MDKKHKILMFFTLFLISSKVEASTPKNYTKTVTTGIDGDILQSKELITSDNSFLFTSCDRYSPYCNITIDTPIEEQNCKIQLSKNNNSITAINNSRRINKNTVIITSLEKKENDTSDNFILKITVVDMSHCNTTQITEYPIEDHDSPMVISPLILKDTIEIFVANKTLCQNYERCRITYDHYGTQIGSPEFFPIFLIRGEPASTSPDGIFFYGYSGSLKMRAMYINRKNSEVIDLMAETTLRGSVIAFYKSTASADNGLYTACWQDDGLGNSTARCMQFDHFGKKQLDAAVKFGQHESLLGVYNLANGGILFFGSNSEGLVYVRKIDVDGAVGKPVGLDFVCYQRLPNFSLSVSESRDNFHIYMACAANNIEVGVRHTQKMHLNKYSLNFHW